MVRALQRDGQTRLIKLLETQLWSQNKVGLAGPHAYHDPHRKCPLDAGTPV